MTNRDPAVPVTRIGADQLTPADPTPGMARSVAMHEEGMWTGVVDTEPASGWVSRYPDNCLDAREGEKLTNMGERRTS